MTQIIIPTWDNIREIVSFAEERVLICSPYYSSAGIDRVFDSINNAKLFRFWTRFSPSDWVVGATSPKDLLAFIDLLTQSGRTVELAAFQRLHAKAYAADYSLALIGSANLSDGGFNSNLELVVKFEGDEAETAIKTIEENFNRRLRPVDVESIRTWIYRYEPTIFQIRTNSDNSAEELLEVQRSLDELLGFGQEIQRNQQIEDFSHREFGRWLGYHLDFPGANVLNDRFNNTQGQNLTGHFKQCFYGITGFLLEHKEYVSVLLSELTLVKPGSVYDINQRILNSWFDYFDNQATLFGREFNFSVLRNILPPSVGGTRYGGGGGISTFKRMLPLVAAYLDEEINE